MTKYPRYFHNVCMKVYDDDYKHKKRSQTYSIYILFKKASKILNNFSIYVFDYDS